MPQPSSHQPVNRRDFARAVAATTATAVVSSTHCVPGEAGEATDEPAKPGTDKKPTSPPPPAVLMLEVLRQQYPHENLDKQEILQGIYNDLRGDLARSRRLSKFPLENTDEPAFRFSADVSPR